MATVFFSRRAENDLKKLPIRVSQEFYSEHMHFLEGSPRAGKALHGPLRGYFSYEFHVGGISYRAAYEMIELDVVILMIDTRDNFYKKLSKRAC